MIAPLLLVLAARVDQLADAQPTILPREDKVPTDPRFLVLWPEHPDRVWLVDGQSEKIPATFERLTLGGGHEAVSLRPRDALAPDSLACVRIGQRSGYWERCFEVQDRVDRAAPSGGELLGALVGGGEAWLSFAPGKEDSPLFLELALSGVGETCRDYVYVPKAALPLGVTIDLVDPRGPTPGTGTRCFQGLPDPAAAHTLRVRWWDAAGNAGPWSGGWTLAAGLSPGEVQAFTAP